MFLYFYYILCYPPAARAINLYVRDIYGNCPAIARELILKFYDLSFPCHYFIHIAHMFVYNNMSGHSCIVIHIYHGQSRKKKR